MATPFSPGNPGKRQAASGKRQAASGKRGFTGWNLPLPLKEPKLNHSRTGSVNLGPVPTAA
jgi:hypothetical protein